MYYYQKEPTWFDFIWETKWWIIGVSAIVALVVWVIALAIEEKREWEQYVIDHNCKVIAKHKGQTISGNTLDAKGQLTYSSYTTASTTTYRCDDGTEYTR